MNSNETTTKLTHKDVEISITPLANSNTLFYITLWRVLGLPHTYPTKIAAESAARATFPDESEAQRYGRVYFVEFELER